MLAEYVVSVKLGSVEVYVSACLVCIALIEEGLDHLDIIRDEIGRRFNHIRSPDVQLGAV